MSPATRQFITDLLDAWNAHDVDRVAAFYAPDYQGVDVAEAAPQHGRPGIRGAVARYLRAFPDLHVTLEEAVVEADRVALIWTAQGTHQGTLMRIPPTGRVVAVRGVFLFLVEDGRIRSGSYIWDVAGFLRAIGLLPEL